MKIFPEVGDLVKLKLEYHFIADDFYKGEHVTKVIPKDTVAQILRIDFKEPKHMLDSIDFNLILAAKEEEGIVVFRYDGCHYRHLEMISESKALKILYGKKE